MRALSVVEFRQDIHSDGPSENFGASEGCDISHRHEFRLARSADVVLGLLRQLTEALLW